MCDRKREIHINPVMIPAPRSATRGAQTARRLAQGAHCLTTTLSAFTFGPHVPLQHVTKLERVSVRGGRESKAGALGREGRKDSAGV